MVSKIKIKYTQNDSEEEHLIESDILFIACGCKKALEFLTDATDEEKEIFGNIKPANMM